MSANGWRQGSAEKLEYGLLLVVLTQVFASSEVVVADGNLGFLVQLLQVIGYQDGSVETKVKVCYGEKVL